MPIANAVTKLRQLITGKPEASSLDTVARRFLQVFQEHGVEKAQIPRLLPQIQLGDLKTHETLLDALTPEILDQAAQLFGVRVSWLEGVDDQIYEYCHCYKQPERLFEHLATLRRDEDGSFDIPVRVLVATDHLDSNAPRQQPLVLVLVEKVAELGEEEIERYYIYHDGWDWSYFPTRIQLKAMVRMIYKFLHMPVPIFVINPGDLQNIFDGMQIPRRCLDRCPITDPSLEDYAFAESGFGKEAEEIPAVLEYIQGHKLESMISEELLQTQLTPQPPPSPECPPEQPSPVCPQEPAPQQVKLVSETVLKNNAFWEPVIAAAKTLWSHNKKMSISEVVRRIKMHMPLLGVSGYTDSAIRKRIAKFAPLGIRGKSGRKPNKLP
jgi:hypothetical protein